MRVPRYSMRIAFRFALVLAVLLPALCAVTLSGLHGLHTGRAGANTLYKEHLQGTLKVASLQAALQNTERASLELLLEDDQHRRDELTTLLNTELIPAVQDALEPVATLSAQDGREVAAVQTINANLARFEGVLADQLPRAVASNKQAATEDEISATFGNAVRAASAITNQEVADANAAYRSISRDYDFSIELMLLAGIVGLLCSIATVIWLIRSVLPRTLSYSAFATEIAQGDYSRRLKPQGRDELAQLGRVLDDLAEGRATENAYDREKLELIEALQAIEQEHDAHQLLRRHLELTISDTQVTAGRPNSADTTACRHLQ